MGTGFVFAASPFSGIQGATAAGLYTYPLNVYFTLTSSVVMTYCFSAIFGNYKVGIRESIVGILGGVAMIASVASYINNIGVCLLVGMISGFISGLWMRKIYPRINKERSYDQFGLIGVVLVNSFIGCLILAPVVFGVYKNRGLTPQELNIAITTNRSSIYYLTIFGITLGISILTGLLAGILCLIFRNPADDFNFTKLVSDDFGLYVVPERASEIRQEANPSAQNLHSKNPSNV